jgi:hypothetical protein
VFRIGNVAKSVLTDRLGLCRLPKHNMHTSSWCLRYRRAVPLPAKVPLLRTGTYPVPESVQYSTAVVVLEWALLEVRFKPAPFPKTGKDAAPESIPLVRCTYTAKSLAANTRQGCTMVVTIPVAKLEFGVVNRHYIPQRKGAPMKLMTKKLNGVCLLALAMTFIACSKSAPPSQPAVQPQATTTPPPATSTASPTAEAPSAAARAVKTEMRNVNFHLTNKAAARIDTLSGEIWLAQTANLWVERKGHRYYRRHTFSNFKVFSVDTTQTAQRAKESYTFTNTSDRDLLGVLTVKPAVGTELDPVTISFTIPAGGSILKFVGPGKDVNVPVGEIASAVFVHNGKPESIKVDAHLLKESSLDVVPDTPNPSIP